MSITIVGRGEIGRVFERCARAAGEDVVLIGRGEDPGTPGDGPILLAVREDDVAALVGALRPFAGRLVFLQNGFVDPLVAPLGPVTRGLLWFTAKGPLFRVLAPSPFFGPRAAEVVQLLSAGGVAAEVLEREADLGREVVVKLAWNNVVGLPLAVSGLPLARYLAERAEEARAIVRETCVVVGAALGIEVDESAAFARLVETTRELGALRGGKKAVAFRNGAVVRLAAELGLEAPANAALLASSLP